jgi:hypothetical protein
MLLAAALPAAAAPREPGPSPGSVALRSLVLPGWGQAANGRWLKAAAALGIYGGFWAWGVNLNQDKQDAEGSLHAAPEEEQGFWTAEVNRLDDARNAKFWFAGLTLILAVTDAFVDAHLRGFDQEIDAEVGWIPDGERDGGMLGFRVTAPLDDGGRRAR